MIHFRFFQTENKIVIFTKAKALHKNGKDFTIICRKNSFHEISNNNNMSKKIYSPENGAFMRENKKKSNHLRCH